jgi:four helix bundle protein
MTYKNFEDLPVWQKAADLYEKAEDLLERKDFAATRGFRDHLDRAALSFSNNIAEGFERGTTNELLAFIYIARGSAGEVRSLLTVRLCRAVNAGWPSDLKSRILDLKMLAENCSRQLRGWADSLQNSDIKGPRQLNERVRKDAEQRKRSEDFQRTLLRHLPEWHPKRKEAEEKGLI